MQSLLFKNPGMLLGHSSTQLLPCWSPVWGVKKAWRKGTPPSSSSSFLCELSTGSCVGKRQRVGRHQMEAFHVMGEAWRRQTTSQTLGGTLGSTTVYFTRAESVGQAGRAPLHEWDKPWRGEQAPF